MTDWKYLLDILLAVALGFAIGYERKLREKEAGIRTHTVVCMGSALMMIVSKYGFSDFPDTDVSRVAAQIVSGIGFLGAGIIVYQKHETRGLTTAAGVWATAGIGMACGARMYLLATGTTVIMICVQCLLHLNCGIFRTKRRYRLRIRFIAESGDAEHIKELFHAEQLIRTTIDRVDGGVVYDIVLNMDRELSSEELGEAMRKNPCILLIESKDDN